MVAYPTRLTPSVLPRTSAAGSGEIVGVTRVAEAVAELYKRQLALLRQLAFGDVEHKLEARAIGQEFSREQRPPSRAVFADMLLLTGRGSSSSLQFGEGAMRSPPSTPAGSDFAK